MNIHKSIYNEIKKYNTIYIVRHIGPDPDAFASQMAMKETILETFPNKKVYALGATVSRFKYFGKIDKVKDIEYENSLLIALDVPDIKRVDVEEFNKFKNIIKIDHHPFIESFGGLEYIDEDASSASELVALLIKNTKLKMTKSIAGKLYMGIVSDSIRFMVSTTSRTFEVVSSLVRKYDLDLNELYNTLYLRPLSEVRLLGHIALTMKVNKNGFAYVELDNDIIKSMGADITAASNMINEFNNISELLVWLFITYDEKNNLYKFNIRSRGPIINKIATSFGGGGHKYACGIRTPNKECIDEIIKKYDDLCKEYKERGKKNGNNKS